MNSNVEMIVKDKVLEWFRKYEKMGVEELKSNLGSVLKINGDSVKEYSVEDFIDVIRKSVKNEEYYYNILGDFDGSFSGKCENLIEGYIVSNIFIIKILEEIIKEKKKNECSGNSEIEIVRFCEYMVEDEGLEVLINDFLSDYDEVLYYSGFIYVNNCGWVKRG